MSSYINDEGFTDVTFTRKFLSRVDFIGPDAILVYMYICSRVNMEQYWEKDVKEAWPGIRDISERLKIGEKRVIRAINKLEYLGYFSISRNFKKVHHYYILPGIEDDREFILRCNKYAKLENLRKGISDSAWPTLPARSRTPHIE